MIINKTKCYVVSAMIGPEKSIYRVSDISSNQDDFTDIHHPHVFNHKCFLILRKQKDLITQYNQSRKWDKYKKNVNDYELIFTSTSGLPNVSSFSPISRSFFKLWEILHDLKDELPASLTTPSTQFRSCSVAEGPGGFIEALVKYRRDIAHAPRENSKYFGMTLISPNKNVPNWKLSRDLCKDNNVHICYGEDGTGNLYKYSNLEYLQSEVGAHSCDLVTGDGGFDYSNDFNEQEDASLPLLVNETLAAFMLLKPGGAFILKIFDISQRSMFRLLYILYTHFQGMYFIKPFSSRPANSEKYLVCTGYKGATPTIIQTLRKGLNTKNSTNNIDALIPTAFSKEIVYYNVHYTTKQMISIIETLEFIDYHDSQDTKTQRQNDAKCIRRQLECALRWCYKYNIPINIKALKYYKETLDACDAT